MNFDDMITAGAIDELKKMTKIEIKVKADVPKVFSVYYQFFKNGDLVLDGETKNGLRGAINKSLFKTRISKGATSAIRIEWITNKEFDRRVAEGKINKDHITFFVKTKDGKGRWLNGINIEDYPHTKWEIAYLQCKDPSVFKRVWRETYSKPKLAILTKR